MSLKPVKSQYLLYPSLCILRNFKSAGCKIALKLLRFACSGNYTANNLFSQNPCKRQHRHAYSQFLCYLCQLLHLIEVFICQKIIYLLICLMSCS